MSTTAADHAKLATFATATVSNIRRRLPLLALAPIVFLAACSGGGGGGASSLPKVSSLTLPTAAPITSTQGSTSTTTTSTGTTSTGTTSTTPTTIAGGGTVVDLPYDGTAAHPGFSVLANGSAATAGAPIAGATVFVGPQILLGSTPPATVPAGYVSAVTDANGVFHLVNPPTGNETITIYAPAPHVAVIHEDLALASTSSPAGTFYMTVPSATESAWFAQENNDRATFGIAPTTFDESVIEAARYWATFMQNNRYFSHCIPAASCGETAATPASYGPQDVDPAHRFYFEHGFSGASEGENIADNFSNWTTVDAAFMNEQKACPNDQPANCAFTSATGHFLNIVSAQYAWTGFAINDGSTNFFDQEFAVIYQTSPHLATPSQQLRVAPGLDGSNI
jgi:uncharacterized protein YkwD